LKYWGQSPLPEEAKESGGGDPSALYRLKMFLFFMKITHFRQGRNQNFAKGVVLENGTFLWRHFDDIF